MTNFEDRWLLLAAALASALPESREWNRGMAPAGNGGDAPREYWMEAASPIQPTAQKLVVRLRHDGDLQVEYHVEGKRGSPFEALFLVPDHEEVAVTTAVAHFVSDLVNERLVLAYADGIIGGGRRFLALEKLAMTSRGLSWVTSWRGTYDRN